MTVLLTDMVRPIWPVTCAWIGRLPAPGQSVVDDDTLAIRGVRYRLCGIDAPETGASGGRAAAAWLRAYLAGRAVLCVLVGQGTPCDGRSERTSYRRIVAQCFADGEDIAAAPVRAGQTRDWPRFSGGYYGR